MRRHVGGAGTAAPAPVPRKHRLREASGHRPPPLRGAARKGWTGQDERGESPAIGRAKSPPSESRKHGPEAQNRRGGAPKGVALSAAGRARRSPQRAEAGTAKWRLSALRLPRGRRTAENPLGRSGVIRRDTRTHASKTRQDKKGETPCRMRKPLFSLCS